MSRTRKIIPANIPDFWEKVTDWAAIEGLKIVGSSDDYMKFKVLHGALPPVLVVIRKDKDAFVIEAWLKCNLFNRIIRLFLVERENKIDSGGIIAVVPKRMARRSLNKLLFDLNMPLID